MAVNTPDVITIRTREEAKTKSGPNAGSPYYIVTDTTERKMFVFDTALAPILKPGSTVEIETMWNKDGKSERITSAKPANGRAPASRLGAPYVVPPIDREQSIRRQVALKCATDLVIGAGEPTTEKLLAAARLLVDWLDNDDDSPF